ncbi:MAG: rod shape-determining protein MreC [bacterium]|nr:rod shape-determining protein MreC [bacterium]
MTYLLKSSVKKRKPLRFSILLLVFFGVVLIGLRLIGPLEKRGALYTVATPFWKISDFVLEKTTAMRAAFASKEILEKENKTLRLEKESFLFEWLYIDKIKAENEELKRMLGREKPEEVLAAVLSGPPESAYDTLVIDAGLSLGFQKGNLVLSGVSAIGVLEEVYKHTSLVRLFSSSGTSLPARFGTSDLRVQMYGKGGGNFEISLPKDMEAEIGENIFLPGMDNYLLATIETITDKDTEAFKTLLLRSEITLSTVRFVTVVPQVFVPPRLEL